MHWMEIELTGREISRRSLLAVLAAAGPAFALYGTAQAIHRPRLYLSARGDDRGGYRATGLMPGDGIAFDIDLPARGHSMALAPDGRKAVFFGRRPGAFALVVDIRAGKALKEIPAAPGRWFDGHGVFAPDGARLFATETVAETGDGVVGIYDAGEGWRRLGEWPSGGLDPHDIRLLSDGRTLVVANGGILHHADAPRAILNLDTMAPSLAYLDVRTGAPVAAATLPPELHQLSIRHLEVAPGDRVAIAMQYEGPAGDAVPLIGAHRRGDAAIRIVAPPPDVLRSLRHYCGSAAMDASGRFLGVTSPRGGMAIFWDLTEDRYTGACRMADCCGIAAAGEPGAFLVTSGYGSVTRFEAPTGRVESSGPVLEGAKWDNHMLAVPAG